jgi:hypothetical protein
VPRGFAHCRQWSKLLLKKHSLLAPGSNQRCCIGFQLHEIAKLLLQQ